MAQWAKGLLSKHEPKFRSPRPRKKARSVNLALGGQSQSDPRTLMANSLVKMVSLRFIEGFSLTKVRWPTIEEDTYHHL